MTTLVSNPNSGRNKSNKDKKIHPNKASSTSGSVSSSNVPPSHSNPATSAIVAVNESSSSAANNQVGEEFRNHKNDKFQPTAEQMRIASLMSDKKDDDLKPKIEKIVELTGATREDAAVALYDCDNDMPKAIEMILDGEALDSEWQSTGRKKKTKSQSNQVNDVITNGNNKPTEKSNRSNKNNANLGTQTKGQRGGMQAGKNNRKKDFRTNDNTKNNENNEDGGDVFNSNADQPHKKIGGGSGASGKRGGGASRGRGTRGKGIARGSRTFMNRGMQGTNSSNNDGFPNSIETWTNNAVEPSKPANDLNTMTVGNWSDVAPNEDWSEDDAWTSAPMETKVFTPSTKVIPEKDELKEQNKTLNHTSNDSQVNYLSSVNKNEETNSQPTMSAIISNNIKRPSPASAGQVLLQQIQQSNVSQNSNLHPYDMSQFAKQATESIKSLVGIASNNMVPNEHSLENLTKTSQPQNQNRLKVQNTLPSKIPESAVEMPSSDPNISNLTVHFGSLEFGSSSFPMSSNDSGLFDSVNQNAAKKTDNKNLPLLSANANATDTTNYRSTNTNSTVNKNILQGQVLPHSLNDSILSNDHRNDKSSLNASSFNSNKSIERKSDYISMSYKSNYQQTAENVYSSSAYQPASITTNVGYYSNANQVAAFGPSNNTGGGNNAVGNVAVNQPLIPNNAYSNSVYNNTSAQKVIRDMENNSVQNPQVNASTAAASKSYDSSTNVGTSLSLMSSSTSTTNAIKNTLPSTGKGIHNVPPGVTNSVQPTQVLSAPYIVGNAGLPIAYPYYDLQFQTTARDPTYSAYATPDVKYNRNSESELLPVSSQAASAVQTATQAHNHYFSPGYGFFYGFQGLYGATAQPALYPVPQAQNTAPANSAFAKPSTTANYGSHHSYNSGYDSMGTAVPQTQDYVSKSYQQHKQIAANAAGDISTNPQNMYNKAHPQLNKNYDKQGFQAQAQQLNLPNPAQSAANLSSAYNSAYMLPHQQAMHHSFATNAEPTQQTSAVANQRTLSQAHKNINSNTGSYGKFWN